MVAFRALLVSWATSFMTEVDNDCRDWSTYLKCARVFAAPQVLGADRLVVEVESKVVRDELCG